jgi:predicted dinucleotide-binding enzyme
MAIRNVAVVGTGAVGAALAKNLVRSGIGVELSALDMKVATEIAASLGKGAKATETKALGESVDAVFLAVPAEAAPLVLEAAKGLRPGTIVIDCTNPIKWDAGPVAATPAEGSMTAHLAKKFPSLRLVKGWNTFGAEFHERPELGGGKADLYYAGDDAAAKGDVGVLARAMGFDPVDVGPLRNAQHLESLAILWIHMATVGGRGRDVAFKLLPR